MKNVIILLLSMALTGCASDVLIKIDSPTPSATASQRKLAEVKVNDLRTPGVASSKREAAFGVPMGNITFEPRAAEILKRELEVELTNLLAMKGLEKKQFFTSDLLEFGVNTDTTPVYWDVIGKIRLRIKVGEKVHNLAGSHTERTYVWPGEEIIKKVVNKSLSQISSDLRKVMENISSGQLVNIHSKPHLLADQDAPQQTTQERNRQTINMGYYSVIPPPGNSWNVELNKETGRIRFTKPTKSPIGDKGLPVTTIIVGYNWVTQEDMLQLSEQEIADEYRDGEIANMNSEGVIQGSYQLHEVKKDKTMLDGKKLYTLNYKQKGGEWFGKDIIGESILYVYFPPNYQETHKFFLFLISQINEIEKHEEADFTPINTVIKSLQIQVDSDSN